MPKLKQVDTERVIVKRNIDKDCAIKDVVKSNKGWDLSKGCIFYEFTHDMERISEDQCLLLMKKDVHLYNMYYYHSIHDCNDY